MSARATRVLIVSREAAGSRLDRFLAVALDVSRSEAQRWIAAGHVTVEGVLRGASGHVREGERVACDPVTPATTTALPEDGVEFAVLYVDDDVIVVNKPAGLVVHPARGHATGTLVNGLLALGLFRGQDAADERPGIVHRLDKGTSGVMVVARTPESREKLKVQFQAHTIERAYRALVVGEATDATHDTLYRLPGATHVECTLQTGRTHQIRVHLAESGTPVLGDPVYGKPPKDAHLRAVGERLGHQALHARVLGFLHPTTGRLVRFEAEPPADFGDAMRALIDPQAV